MTTYTLSPENLRELKNRLTIQISTLAALVFVASFIAAKIALGKSAFMMLFPWPSLIVSSMVLLGGLLWVRQETRVYAAFEIALDDNSICRNKDRSDQTEIHRLQIREIIQIDGQGITVLGSASSDRIFVPEVIWDYGTIANVLRSWIRTGIKRRLGLWATFMAAFSLLLGLALAILTWGYFPKESKPIDQICLILFWITVVGSSLASGEAGVRVYSVTRQEKPLLYWVLVSIECIPFLWLPSFDLEGFLKMETSTIVAIVLTAIIWISVLSMIVVDGLRITKRSVSGKTRLKT